MAPKQAEPQRIETSRSAIASLVFGLVWLGGIGSILAVAFGHYSLKQIRRSGGRLAGHGIAMAGTVLGYIGIVGAIAVVLMAAYLLGEEINTTSDAQGTETTTSVASITTTTLSFIERQRAADALLFWADTDEEAATAWAEDAIEYVESLNRTWTDREAAINSTADMAVRVCRQLSTYDKYSRVLLGTGDDLDSQIAESLLAARGRSPAQVEADMRERYGQEQWDLYVATWFDSLVNGLCVR